MSGDLFSKDAETRDVGSKNEAANRGSSGENDARSSVNEARLVDEGGLSKDEIDTIRAKVPDLDVKILKNVGDDDIEDMALAAVQLCEQLGSSVVLKFNNTVVVVSAGETKDQIVTAAFEAYMDRLPSLAKKALHHAILTKIENRIDLQGQSERISEMLQRCDYSFHSVDPWKEKAADIAARSTIERVMGKGAADLEKYILGYQKDVVSEGIRALQGLGLGNGGRTRELLRNLLRTGGKIGITLFLEQSRQFCQKLDQIGFEKSSEEKRDDGSVYAIEYLIDMSDEAKRINLAAYLYRRRLEKDAEMRQNDHKDYGHPDHEQLQGIERDREAASIKLGQAKDVLSDSALTEALQFLLANPEKKTIQEILKGDYNLGDRPDYVSGYTFSSLNVPYYALEDIYQEIIDSFGADAGRAYVRMVNELPKNVTPTDFIRSVLSLANNRWGSMAINCSGNGDDVTSYFLGQHRDDLVSPQRTDDR